MLARCLRGFYAGWVFWPEKLLIFGLRSLGRKLVAVGFEGVDMDGPQIVDPLDLSREKLPEKGTVLLGGNFMVLDKYVKGGGEEEGLSFVEIGLGIIGRGLRGCIVLRWRGYGMEKEEGCRMGRKRREECSCGIRVFRVIRQGTNFRYRRGCLGFMSFMRSVCFGMALRRY